MQQFQVNFHLLNQQSDANQSERYYRYAFHVDEPSACLHLTADYSRLPDGEKVQTPFFLFDPKHQVRFMRAANMAASGDVQTLELSQQDASKGGIPGTIPQGDWLLIVFKRRMSVSFDLTVTLTISGTPSAHQEAESVRQLQENPFSSAVLAEQPDWYCGELHTHSNQSTGYTDIEEVVRVAEQEQLDFLAVTDHFTMAHWLALQKMHHEGRPLLMQSAEISGDMGHANVHGLHAWINPLVDDNESLAPMLNLPEGYSMNHVADEVHRQGGLFSINHPLSGIMGWRYRDFDLHKADLFEIYCSPEEDVTLQNLSLWDRWLCDGYHLTGVASSDSHHPTEPDIWKLSEHVTWIYAEKLSQQGLLDGLRRGHAYAAAKGCRMTFTARCGEQTAMMGDTLSVPHGQKVQFHVTMENAPAGNLFIVQDGTILDMRYFDGASHKEDTFSLTEHDWQEHSYLRLEYYQVEGERPYFGYSNHSWREMQFLSNPIWLKRSDD
jgi:hypothetical protein